MERLVRIREVIAAVGRGQSSLYVDIDKGLFPKPVKVGPNCIAWPESEIAQLNAARIAGKSDREIKALVAQLEKRRVHALDSLAAAK
jgi:prophage regulatory protein